MSNNGHPDIKVVLPPSALKAKQKAAIEYISNLMADIDSDNAAIKEAVKYRSQDTEWNEKTLKKMCSIHNRQNFAAFKADIETITNKFEALYGSDMDIDDYEVESITTTSAELRECRKNAIEYISSMMDDVDIKTMQLKDAIKLKAPQVDLEEKVLRKMATMRNKNSFFSFRAENEALTDDYETIFGQTQYE